MSTQAQQHYSGELDEAYGVGGVVEFDARAQFEDYDTSQPWLDEQDRALLMVLLTDAQTAEEFPALRRYLKDGQPDVAFGAAGTVSLDRAVIPSPTLRYNVARRNDGRILAVCSTQGSNGFFDIYAVQCLQDGALDRSFGEQGVKRVGSFTSAIQTISLQADGKVLLAGANAGYGMVVRLNEGGELDATWGNLGTQLHHFGEGNLVLFQALPADTGPEGSVLVLGNDTQIEDVVGFFNNFVIARLLPDGALDPAFGPDGNGIVRESFPTADKGLQWIQLVQANDRLLVTLSIIQARTHMWVWQRQYTGEGAFDTAFNGGRPWLDFFQGGQTGSGLKTVVAADGKILMAGYANAVLSNNIPAVIRYLPNGNGRDTAFGDEGVAAVDRWPNALVQAYGLAIQSDGKYLVLSSRRPGGGVLMRLFP